MPNYILGAMELEKLNQYNLGVDEVVECSICRNGKRMMVQVADGPKSRVTKFVHSFQG